MMIDPVHATGWLAVGRLALDLLRAALDLRPHRPANAPATSSPNGVLDEARAAHDLGYRLCRCKFPPKPMLWDNSRRIFVCQNPACGRTEDAASA